MNSQSLFQKVRRDDEIKVFQRLVNSFHAAAPEPAERRWRILMAAHIVGQMNFRHHVQSHWLMLRFAVSTRDLPEVSGQLFRLLLVPLGHALGRLPAGNIGRATVSAFQPMALSPDIRLVVAEARKSARAMAAPTPSDTHS